MRRSQLGQNLAELAIALPIFFLLLAGVVDIGRALSYRNVIVNAAREGARYGSRYHWQATGITAAAEQELASAGITSDYTVSIECRDPGAAVVACDTAQAADSIVVGVVWSGFDSLLPLITMPPIQYSAEMVIFGFRP